MEAVSPEHARGLIEQFDFRSVHPKLYFGTASDRYAGWIGQIYSSDWSDRVKKRTRTLGGAKYEERTVPVASSAEYFEHFRVVEIDFTFYRSLRNKAGTVSNNYFVLQQYADAAPDDAQFILKAPQEVTARILRRTTAGKLSYEVNPDYLNQDVFTKGFLAPAHEILGDRLRGVIFEQEYQRKASSPEPGVHIDQLSSFFSSVNSPTQIHLEIRSPHLLTPAYFEWLENAGLGFVFSHWTWLPPLREQWKLCGASFSSSGQDVIMRLLTPLRMPYAKAYALAHPFDKPVAELSESDQAKNMVLDSTALAIQSLKHDYAAMIISNNRAWGNAPSLAQKVARRILEELEKEKSNLFKDK